MPRFRGKRPLRIKHVVDSSTILAATSNTVAQPVVDNVPAYALSDSNGVPTGSVVRGFYLSSFYITEGGEVANEVPLVDWYVIHNPGGAFGVTFDANNLPTPGSTGLHKNKRFIIHEEKGLAGGGDASLAGVPMVFKGVIGIPRKWHRSGEGDLIQICHRANFATKFCIKTIYHHEV